VELVAEYAHTCHAVNVHRQEASGATKPLVKQKLTCVVTSLYYKIALVLRIYKVRLKLINNCPL
jgi:hypothetical protein